MTEGQRRGLLILLYDRDCRRVYCFPVVVWVIGPFPSGGGGIVGIFSVT
jgi:hypothetical protein